MQPYQKAGKQIQKRSDLPAKALGTAATFAIGAPAVLNKVTSLLNKFIPNQLAFQGLQKLNPNFKKFFDIAAKNGYSIDNALDFMRSKQGMKEDMSPLSPENIDIRYPNLFSFIDNEIDQGRSPLEAAGLAKINGFDKDMAEIEKEMGRRFSDLIEQLYSNIQAKQPQQAQQPIQAQQQAVQAPQQAQSGQGQASQDLLQAIMAAQAARQRRSQ